MKTPSNITPGDHPSPWEKLFRRAASDSPPPVDAVALLRVVREAAAPALPPAAAQADWLAELSDWLSAKQVIPACLAVTCMLAAAATWQAAEVWAALDWAQWGGAL